MITKRIVFGFVVCMLVVFAATARAGFKASGVPVILGDHTFSGLLGSTRSSSDSAQVVGCAIGGFSGSWAWCAASDATGKSASCITTDADLIGRLHGITIASNLFVKYDDTGHCTAITVQLSSSYEPMVP
jgi:hypothetical protein